MASSVEKQRRGKYIWDQIFCIHRGVNRFLLTGIICPQTPIGSTRVYVKKFPSANIKVIYRAFVMLNKF